MKQEVIISKYGFKVKQEKKLEYVVYCLYCPKTKTIRYIGVTNQGLIKRLQGHISEAFREKTKKAIWLKTIIRKYKAVYARELFKFDNSKEARTKELNLIEAISLKRRLVNSENAIANFRQPKKK